MSEPSEPVGQVGPKKPTDSRQPPAQPLESGYDRLSFWQAMLQASRPAGSSPQLLASLRLPPVLADFSWLCDMPNQVSVAPACSPSGRQCSPVVLVPLSWISRSGDESHRSIEALCCITLFARKHSMAPSGRFQP
ncbi:hypothetical protein NDU88_002533 [Pleurodeles waltl]|uniref:Uncharacterized protein n=1 Tax=Pleurodeles waltl TaxID=8319 RepID=A0AAV7KT22_PLEWA|nr:hypothetical protein NDU88_002533 [Pleurodeles waltl]